MWVVHSVMIDNQIFTQQVHGGISRYFAELVRHRHSIGGGIDLTVNLPVTFNEHLGATPGYGGYFVQAEGQSFRDRLVRKALYQLGSVAPRGYRHAELLHHTYYRPEVLRRTPGMRRVSTLFDMIPERAARHFPSGNPHQAKRQYLERSDLIISISRASADDMLTHWPDLSDREIAVVPLGVGEEFSEVGPRHSEPRPYLLHVGSRAGYKNFRVLLQALAVGGTGMKELSLLAAGGGPFTPEERSAIEGLGLGTRVRQVPVTDRGLAGLYRGAHAFVSPSLHEGFGLPTLEAMACGCPVLLSDTAVYREVGSEAPFYFDPRSPEALVDAIRLVNDDVLRATGVTRGLAIARRSTWQAMAEQTGRAYARVL